MALAQHKTIPTLPFGILGIYVHFLEIQIGEHICRGQAAAGMAGFGTMGCFDDTHAHLAGSHPQLLLFIGGQRNHFLILYSFLESSGISPQEKRQSVLSALQAVPETGDNARPDAGKTQSLPPLAAFLRRYYGGKPVILTYSRESVYIISLFCQFRKQFLGIWILF